MLLNYYLASLLSFVPSSSEASLFALMTVALIVGAVLYLMTKNSVFAVGFALLAEIALYFSQKIFPERFENLFSEFVAKMSVFEQFYSFLDGIFDLTAVVYFGAVGIKKTRYALPAALFADFVGFFMASMTVRLLY